VRLPISGVVELVRPDGVVERVGIASGLMVVVLGVLESHGRHGTDVCAEQAEEINFALRLRVGHVDDQVIALGTADVCETNAGVSSGAFYYGSAGLEQAALFGILDDVECGTVFDGAAWVLKLGLA
jgi:hypothetical protein